LTFGRKGRELQITYETLEESVFAMFSMTRYANEFEASTECSGLKWGSLCSDEIVMVGCLLLEHASREKGSRALLLE
jgi:hypothetical protein